VNVNNLCLTYASFGLFNHHPVLMDGENVVIVDEHTMCDWRHKIQLEPPVFASEVDEHMLEEWKFVFELAGCVEKSKLKRASMSKPNGPRGHEDKYWCSTSPCDAMCSKCEVVYPVWGRYCIGSKQKCDACGYVYEFVDW